MPRPLDDAILRAFVGNEIERFSHRESLPGLVTRQALASLERPHVDLLCARALAHECEALEQRAANDDDRQASDAHADSDGRVCGASFCGFYHERDVFSWAERCRAEERTTPTSRAVDALRCAVEAMIVAEGVPLHTHPVRFEAWLNVLRHGDFLKLHDHAGALVSGVCWLHVPGGAT